MSNATAEQPAAAVAPPRSEANAFVLEPTLSRLSWPLTAALTTHLTFYIQ